MLVALFKGTAGYMCAGDFSNAEDALVELNLRSVDLLLVDISLKRLSGVDYVRRVRAQRPDLPVLMYTVWEDTDQILRALQAGANGYVLKRSPHPELFAAVAEVLAGGAPMSRAVGAKVVRHIHQNGGAMADINRLTEHQGRILHLMSQGHTYDEIGGVLRISPETVRKHLQNICVRLSVNSRAEAIAKFARGRL